MSYQYRSMQTTQARVEVVNAFMRGVYGWMCLGLLVTAAASLFVVSSPALMQAVFGNQILFFGLIIAELALVVGLSAAINRLSAGTASGLFMLYSALNGVTLSAIFVVYAKATIFKAFLVTGGMFGAMSLFGLLTKRDLTAMGSFLIMGVFGILIASIVNIFIASSALQFAISVIGVLVFAGLTAYDTQNIKNTYLQMVNSDRDFLGKAAILGALQLYLDFINLFMFLLQFMGNRE